MSKDQLAEIKYNWNDTDWGINKDDINWLIEQAEILKNLDRYVSTVTNGKFIPEEYIDNLERQNKRYRKALEFYADNKNWTEREVEIMMDGEPTRTYASPVILEDDGKLARTTLEQWRMREK